MQVTTTKDIRDSAANEPGAGVSGATDRAATPAADGEPRAVGRKTLSVRRVVRVGDARLQGKAAAGGSGPGSAIPLKRLTAGRKEISILHDGSTYLLRITKSNKLILTKA